MIEMHRDALARQVVVLEHLIEREMAVSFAIHTIDERSSPVGDRSNVSIGGTIRHPKMLATALPRCIPYSLIDLGYKRLFHVCSDVNRQVSHTLDRNHACIAQWKERSISATLSAH